jgi:hypothetical protein
VSSQFAPKALVLVVVTFVSVWGGDLSFCVSNVI